MPAEEAAIAALRELGFNQLEAEVYVFLLPSPPVTAYRVAQNIARPTANVYKAVESLARKGAILLEEGESRVCRAVPVAEFRKRAERDHRSLLEAAASALSHLDAPAPDERVYRLESASQVFESARDMIAARARKIVLVDAFPAALARLHDPIEQAAKRGLRVLVEAYRPVRIAGATVAHASIAESSLDLWRSEQLNIVIDGREHLFALLSRDLESVYQAVWSNSLYLSCVAHAGRLCEHTLLRMLEAGESGAEPSELLRILKQHRFFVRDEVPGQHELIERYVEKPPARRKKKS